MSDIKIIGYKRMFGFILPDWVSEKMLKSFIFGLFVCMCMFLVYIFAINPKFAEIKLLKNSLEVSRSELEQLKESRDGIKQFQTSLTPNDHRKILSAIPLDYSPDSAVFALRNIASETGASITSYSLPSGVVLDTNTVETIGKRGEMVEFTSYPIKMVVSAPVDVLLKFITKVEASLPFAVVSDLNLQEVTKLFKSEINKNVQMDMEIKYYQAKLNKINVNKIEPLTDNNLEFASKLSGFNEMNIENKSSTLVEEEKSSTPSGDIFGL